jgi:iron-sulfur cluster assembly protein
MNYTSGPEKFEDVVEDKGVTIVIESKALLHVVGTTMDYVTDELTSEFVFHNPNAKGMCGCGESFNT